MSTRHTAKTRILAVVYSAVAVAVAVPQFQGTSYEVTHAGKQSHRQHVSIMRYIASISVHYEVLPVMTDAVLSKSAVCWTNQLQG